MTAEQDVEAITEDEYLCVYTVVPCGKMECFYKAENKERKDWVYCVLENPDLAKEQRLKKARVLRSLSLTLKCLRQ